MPIYEYRCRECSHQFEAQQAFTDDALTECPNCKGALKKLFSAPGITFKGSGFYKNDSRGTSTSVTPPGDSSSSSSTSTESSTSSSSSDSSSGSSSSTTSSGSTSAASTAPKKSD